MLQFWLKNLDGESAKFPATAAGLTELSTSTFDLVDASLCLDVTSLPEEELVNLLALCQKSWQHLSHLFSLPPESTKRCKIWSRYRRNIVDQDNNEGTTFEAAISRYLTDNLPKVKLVSGVLQFGGRFDSMVAAAAIAGRLVNMARWCQKNTQTLKLLSEAKLTWRSFDEISLASEQPIVRRIRRP